MVDLKVLLSFPPEKKVSAKEWDKQAVEYVKRLSGWPSREWTSPVDKQNILNLLDPAVNSIPYLIGLLAQADAAGKNRAQAEEAVTRSVMFFTSFDPIQVRYAGEQWRGLLEWAFQIYPQVGVRDFSPLSTAMLRLDPTAGTFTSSHYRFVRLCIECGVPSQALRILDQDIYAYPYSLPTTVPQELPCEVRPDELSNAYITPMSGLTLYVKADVILEYHLLGAHVYLGLQSFSRARLFLEYVLLYPSSSNTPSALQVEAYKKYLLLGLLTQGKDYGLPRTHNVQVMRAIRACSKPYEALVDSFERRDWRKFDAEIDIGAQIWSDDGNTRLVQECREALMRFRVVDLERTFAALPVSRVAQYLELPADQTLKFLEELISQNRLSATIEPLSASGAANAVLHFNSAQDQQVDSVIDLEDQTKRIESLISFVRDADRRLQLTKEYVDYQKRSKRGMSGPDGDLADQMDLTWDVPISGVDDDDGGEDEDIMAA